MPTVIVTRAESQAASLVRKLAAQGMTVLESPAIRVAPLPFTKKARLCLDNLSRYDGVLFTSANAGEIFLRHWKKKKRSWPSKTALYVIGPKTAEALKTGGLPVRGVANTFVSESLADLLGPVRNKRFLLPRAREGRDVLPALLKAGGARVDLWPLYRTVPVKMSREIKKALLSGRAHGVTFASPSAVHSFMSHFRPAQRKTIFSTTRSASIGPITTQALRSYGIAPVIQAKRSTAEDLALALVRHFAKKGK
ncbi:MAG: uroporphyrinogen-III synthase [Elusimicrobia bacterium]|nr:uroporphyrinogen-III synthase [Elusimicrobiota bacterium]